MALIGEMFRSIWRSLLNFFSPSKGSAPTFQALVLSDPPDVTQIGKLYLIGDSGQFWMATIACPCGCGATIQLPMSKDASPCWVFSGTVTQPTLLPSIHRTKGCKSHFFLRKGLVEWCND